jgi:hypothetical protein
MLGSADCHSGFEPGLIFARIYESTCVSAVAHVFGKDNIVGQHLCKNIKNNFMHLFTYIEAGETATAVRKMITKPYAGHWASLRTTTTCLWCLDLPPEHVLSCGHALCESCVAGTASPTPYPYTFHPKICPLCLEQARGYIRTKPPSVAPCLLSIDGGGIKVVWGIEILKKLDASLGPYERLQDYFHFVGGTSAGEFQSQRGLRMKLTSRQGDL